MNHESSTSAGRSNHAPLSAAQSARSRQLIEELRGKCTEWLQDSLASGLAHFAKDLHDLADSSLDHLEQQSCVDTCTRLVDGSEAFEQRFIASIAQTFERMGRQASESPASAPRTLSLIDTITQDLDTALDQLVARSKARSGQQLVELGFRMAVLLGSSPLESGELPVGPQAMAHAFRDACGTLKMPVEHELLLLQSLETSLINELASLHALANGYLCEAGILRGLRPFVLPNDKARNDIHDRNAKTSVESESTASRRDEPAEYGASFPGAPTAQQAKSAEPAEEGTVSDEQLQRALAALQEHFLQVGERTWFELNQPKRLREELLLQLNIRRSGQGKPVDLSAGQGATLQMIVRLFATISRQLPQTPDALALLYNLQLPLLRMALVEPDFFDKHEHPARMVLGRIAEIAHDWLGDDSESPNRELRIDLEALIVHASRAVPDKTVYLSLLQAIERRLARLKQETQRAEKQEVDGMRGLESLEAARIRAAELLATLVAASPQQAALSTHLFRAWSDVLSLAVLRNGEDSGAFRNRMRVTEQMLGIRPVRDTDMLQQEVKMELRQIGMLETEIDQLVRELIESGHAAQGVAAAQAGDSPADCTSSLFQAKGMNHPSWTVPQSSHAADPSIPGQGVDPEILRIHRHLRSLPLGVWFEFMGSAGTDGIPRRLAWYSPLTGHSLFVTRSGRRAQELGELQLAQAIACGRVRELETVREDVVGDAWRIVSSDQDQHPTRNHPSSA
ncbi:MAG: DUF1631 family protein [Rhodanobacteraceae bacterium]